MPEPVQEVVLARCKDCGKIAGGPATKSHVCYTRYDVRVSYWKYENLKHYGETELVRFRAAGLVRESES